MHRHLHTPRDGSFPGSTRHISPDTFAILSRLPDSTIRCAVYVGWGRKGPLPTTRCRGAVDAQAVEPAEPRRKVSGVDERTGPLTRRARAGRSPCRTPPPATCWSSAATGTRRGWRSWRPTTRRCCRRWWRLTPGADLQRLDGADVAHALGAGGRAVHPAGRGPRPDVALRPGAGGVADRLAVRGQLTDPGRGLWRRRCRRGQCPPAPGSSQPPAAWAWPRAAVTPVRSSTRRALHTPAPVRFRITIPRRSGFRAILTSTSDGHRMSGAPRPRRRLRVHP